MISGKEVWPLIEGGKGISVSNGASTGAWAAASGVGTFSGVNSDSYDENGTIIPQIYMGSTRRERHNELLNYAIQGAVSQAQRAFDVAGNQGRIHMNVLWEMAGAEHVLHNVLDRAKGLIHGITCGAGMPYKLGEIAAKYGVYYYPIVSSGRAFNALWKRAYKRVQQWLGGVVYEDPWLAGGHNGLSNSESPIKPEHPFPRVLQLRKIMNEMGLHKVPIIMAGGVWFLKEWKTWINNPELGAIAFQFGTRPLLTKESPIPDAWKKKLLTIKKGDIYLNHFSPTGFYSSAVKNSFLEELIARSNRQITYFRTPFDENTASFSFGPRARTIYLTPEGKSLAEKWIAEGYSEALRTPDSTLVFETPKTAAIIHKDQVDCMGCLSSCKFSNWSQNISGTTGIKADPRSFCIQKTLQDVSHTGNPDLNLLFAGQSAYRFSTDPFYKNGHIPTTRQLIERILTGE